MLLYKIWLETKTRFFLGLIFVLGVSLFFVLGQPFILSQWALDKQLHPDWVDPWWMPFAIADYRYFIWHFLYNYLLQNIWVIFAVILSLGGIKNEYEQGSSLFTLSLPITRKQLFLQRILVSFSEVIVLALVPVFIIPVFSSFIGKSYLFEEAFLHSFYFILGGIVFYALGVFINTIIKTEVLPFLIMLGVIIIFYVVYPPDTENIAKSNWFRFFDLQSLMAGKSYSPTFLSWQAIGGCLLTGSSLLLLSYQIIKKRDF
ncbi:MAG: ABC transporter permease [Bacteroidota bacterium]|nr:ABC transporter permease [Bacteroidota bacterium]